MSLRLGLITSEKSAVVSLVPAAVAWLGFAPLAPAAILPADRATAWSPGIPGGVPDRTTICANVNASTYGNGSVDASAGIQAALDGCPVGQVVQLSAGTFTVNDFVLLSKGVTLRGAGRATTLQKTNGAKPGQLNVADAQPILIIGPNRWPWSNDSTARNLTADAANGAYSVTVANASGFASGQFVILDEDNYQTGAWKPLPNRNGSPTSVTIWATDRVVWQKHNPEDGADDPFPDAITWFMRSGRPVNELKEIASVSGNAITFTTPLHIGYRTSHTAQLTRYTPPNVHVKYAGIEDLRVIGGSDGAIRFQTAAYSWVKGVEITVWLDNGVAIQDSFRCELRDSYIHDAAWPYPGGGGYAIGVAGASSEILIENNIVLKANKMMVGLSSGAGSVVGYNYMDDGYIGNALDWHETGINGSHMVGSHHMLFEGNESFNYDSDNTHGSSIYHTVFRNHLIGYRRSFPGMGNARAAGLMFGSYWHSFVGNVLGDPARTTTANGWAYEDPGTPWMEKDHIWRLGYDPTHWEQAPDPDVRKTVIREGNFDYVTNQVRWDTAPQTIPPSLYLTGKPAFFGSLPWPWVDPVGATRLYTLPARQRYDAGTPVPYVRVTSITPVTGPIAGGTTVTIGGNGFVDGATVTIGGVPATSVVVAGPTSLTAVTGAHATGLADVTVTIPGPRSATLVQAFFFAPPPTPTSYYTVPPCRAVDTRAGQTPALAPSERRVWTITNQCGVPAGAKAVAFNVTVTGPSANGHIRLAPGNGLTESSAINFGPGQTRANNAVVMLATDDTGGVAASNRSTGPVNLILDVSGYFQ
jgi:hypothetical protein